MKNSEYPIWIIQDLLTGKWVSHRVTHQLASTVCVIILSNCALWPRIFMLKWTKMSVVPKQIRDVLLDVWRAEQKRKIFNSNFGQVFISYSKIVVEPVEDSNMWLKSIASLGKFVRSHSLVTLGLAAGAWSICPNFHTVTFYTRARQVVVLKLFSTGYIRFHIKIINRKIRLKAHKSELYFQLLNAILFYQKRTRTLE